MRAEAAEEEARADCVALTTDLAEERARVVALTADLAAVTARAGDSKSEAKVKEL